MATTVISGASDPPADEVEVPPRVWVISFVIVIGAFMTQLDASMVNIVLAPVTSALHSTLHTTQWIVTGYLLGLVIGLPLCSWWTRRLGAGRLWLASLISFSLVSAACAAAPNAEILIAARVLQGVTGGLMLPAGQTVIAQVAGRERMGRVMSVVGTALVLAPALGPIIGAEVLVHLSWPWLFLINLPVGGAALWIGLKTIPRGQSSQSTRFDMLGFALIGTALPLITYAISRSWQHDRLDLRAFFGPLALGCLALLAFAWHCRRIAAPLLKLSLFSNPRFLTAAALSFVVGLAEFGALVAWPLYFLVIEGYGLVHTGYAMFGFAAGSAVLPLSGRLVDRYGGGKVCFAGALVLAAGYVLAGSVVGAGAPFLALEVSLLLLGIGTALTVVPTFTAAYVAVTPGDLPDAVTVVNILLRVGGAVGVSLVVAVIGNQTTPSAGQLGPFQDAFWMLAGIAIACCLGAAALIRVNREPRVQPKAVGAEA